MGDASPDHEAGAKITLKERSTPYVRYHGVGGKQVTFQTTELANRLAQLCYVKFAAGESKDAVRLFRGSWYNKITVLVLEKGGSMLPKAKSKADRPKTNPKALKVDHSKVQSRVGHSEVQLGTSQAKIDEIMDATADRAAVNNTFVIGHENVEEDVAKMATNNVNVPEQDLDEKEQQIVCISNAEMMQWRHMESNKEQGIYFWWKPGTGEVLTEETYNQMNSNLMKDNMEQPCGEFQIVECAAMQGIFDKYKIGGPAQRKSCMVPETQRKAVFTTIMASKIENPSSFIIKAVTKSAEAESWVDKQ